MKYVSLENLRLRKKKKKILLSRIALKESWTPMEEQAKVFCVGQFRDDFSSVLPRGSDLNAPIVYVSPWEGKGGWCIKSLRSLSDVRC